jgi:ribosomal protein L32
MFKGLRVPEKLFTILMWIVSIVFAGFLIGFGRLVIGDLPRVEQPVEINQFVDRTAQTKLDQQRAGLESRRDANARAREDAELKLETARRDYEAAREAYDTWISTRKATTDPAQDPEVISRNRQLDILNGKVRAAEKVREALSGERLEIDRGFTQIDIDRSNLESAAFPAFERATFLQDLRVFMLRLALTLPLLVIAFWMVAKKRKSEYWPLMRGFVLFAAFAFFVELVPYLPSYGGYIRYLVGIVLTIIASHYIIKWMRHYLANRAVAEQKAEVERKQSIRYEDALKKMSANVCPGCERATATTGDVAADYCVHCGMQLFDTCKSCNTRKLAFFRFCMKCGTAATHSHATGPSSGFVAASVPGS